MAGSRHRGRTFAAGMAAAMASALPAIVAPPPAAALNASVSVAETNLVDFQPVQVTGSGFDGWTLLEVYECQGGAVDESDCDADNAFFIDVDGGTVDDTFYVDARIYLPDGTEVDCRTDPAGCVIGVGFLVDVDEWPTDALDFDPTAPLKPVVTGEVDPSTDLVDEQVVQVAAHDLSPREETFARVCVPGTDDVGYRCDLDNEARGVPDAEGDATGELAVHPTFRTPLGVDIDCLDPGTACAVELTWGYDPPPDRRAVVPIEFRADEPPPTSTPTTTAPPSTPTGTAPAAQPVAAAPTFTG